MLKQMSGMHAGTIGFEAIGKVEGPGAALAVPGRQVGVRRLIGGSPASALWRR